METPINLQRQLGLAFPHQERRILVYSDLREWVPHAGWLPPLDVETERRVARLRFDEDRQWRRLAHGLHRAVAAWYLRLPTSDSFSLVRDHRGAPSLQLANGARIETTIAHSGPHLAFGFAPQGDSVGVDVEVIGSRAAAGLAAIRHLVLGPGEEQSNHHSDVDLLGLWVRKEALLKAVGQGLAIAMDTFQANHATTVRGLLDSYLKSWSLRAAPASDALLGWAAADSDGSLLRLGPHFSVRQPMSLMLSQEF